MSPKRSDLPALSAREIAMHLLFVAYLLLILVVAKLYSGWLALLMLVPVMVIVAKAITALTPQQKRAIADAEQRRRRSPLGIAALVVQIVAGLFLVWLAVEWMIGKTG